MKTLRDFWLGWKDLNPRNDGVRVHCLTAWLHPSICISASSGDLYSIPQCLKNVKHFPQIRIFQRICVGYFSFFGYACNFIFNFT